MEVGETHLNTGPERASGALISRTGCTVCKTAKSFKNNAIGPDNVEGRPCRTAFDARRYGSYIAGCTAATVTRESTRIGG